MEVAARPSARLLQSSNRILLHPSQRRCLSGSRAVPTATTTTAAAAAATTPKSLDRSRRRYLSTTPQSLAPEPHSLFSIGSSGAGSHGGGIGGAGGAGMPTYFGSRSSLPANTIIRFVPQQTAWIVERMGKFHRILEPGLAVLIPFLDRISYVRSLKESAIEIPSQNAITADNVTLELDGLLYTRVFDPYKAR